MNEKGCPRCGSKAYKRNGYTRHGKQNLRCLDCGRQFSVEPFLQESEQQADKKIIEQVFVAAQ